MSKVREEERLTVLGPLGRGFDLPKDGYNPVLVAGGIGIAPLIFLAQTIEPGDMTFMAGYSSVNEILPMEHVGFTSTEISIATDDGTAGHRGPVTELFEARLSGSAEGLPAVFTCGPLPMLKKVATLTLDQGIPCQVSLETYMACGLGACQGCAVKSSSQEPLAYHHVCQDGPVFQAQGVDWGSL
jgi:dihydroorotate dehydrogenase electron transfer subunit